MGSRTSLIALWKLLAVCLQFKMCKAVFKTLNVSDSYHIKYQDCVNCPLALGSASALWTGPLFTSDPFSRGPNLKKYLENPT